MLVVETPTQERKRFERGPIRFGRSTDLELPLVDRSFRAVPTMKRHAGTFVQLDGAWHVRNDAAADETGSMLVVHEGTHGSTRVLVQPQCLVPLCRIGVIELRDGTLLRFDQPAAQPAAVLDTVAPVGDVTRRPVDLTPRMVDFLVALAEPELLETPASLRRTQAEVARLWYVSPKTVEQTLAAARELFRSAGLLAAGSPDELLRQRSQTLEMVRVAVRDGIITADDLAWADLGSATGPRPAAERPA